jgi:hypothetical protein
MRIKKKNINNSSPLQDQDTNDPFLRRMEVQGIIIKKVLGKMDLPFKPEFEVNPEDKMNDLCFEQEENEEQEAEKRV